MVTKSENTTQRPWGFFTNIMSGEGFLVKLIHVNPKSQLSLQSHNHRSEHWHVVKGQATVVLGDKNFVLNIGESVDIKVKQIHSLQNPTENPVEIIEIQRGDILSEEDIIRYQDIYGRA